MNDSRVLETKDVLFDESIMRDIHRELADNNIEFDLYDPEILLYDVVHNANAYDDHDAQENQNSTEEDSGSEQEDDEVLCNEKSQSEDEMVEDRQQGHNNEIEEQDSQTSIDDFTYFPNLRKSERRTTERKPHRYGSEHVAILIK